MPVGHCGALVYSLGQEMERHFREENIETSRGKLGKSVKVKGSGAYGAGVLKL